MKHQSNEKDDKQVMREPEDLKVGPSDDLHRGGDDEDEGEGDHDTRQSCYCRKHHYGRVRVIAPDGVQVGSVVIVANLREHIRQVTAVDHQLRVHESLKVKQVGYDVDGCVEGNHVGHQFVESDVSVKLSSCSAAAALYRSSEEREQISADRQQDQHAVKVETCSWSSGPRESMPKNDSGIVVFINQKGQVKIYKEKHIDPEPYQLKYTNKRSVKRKYNI